MAKLALVIKRDDQEMESRQDIDEFLFRGAKLKIKRANHHIKELALLINSFSQPHRYRLRTEYNFKRAGHDLFLEMESEGLDNIPLLVGDAIHNLRAALDHLVCELITLSGGKVTRRTQFPLWSSRKKTIAEIGGVVQGISVDVVTAFVEQVQPYRGGNDGLFLLHKLDIIDKHRLLVPLFMVSGILREAMRGGERVRVLDFGITRGDKKCAIELPPGAKIQDYDHPVLHVLFEGVEGFERQAVVPTLHRLRQMVARVVCDVTRAYLDGKRIFSRQSARTTSGE